LNNRFAHAWFTLLSALVATSCGGGDSSSNSAPPPPNVNAARIAAATSTAENNDLCDDVRPFYWEIGDKDGALASGSVGGNVGADTSLDIASSSKWLFAAYVLETRDDVAQLIPFLNFTSGYSNFSNLQCNGGTVADCMNGGINAAEAAAQTFHYQGGHMQQLAIEIGLGALTSSTLASEVRSGLGDDIALTYVSPQPPGGVRTTAAHYAAFLRKLLAGSAAPLQMGAALGSQAVCTSADSGCNAASEGEFFIPEPFHYSLGHWVEDNAETTPENNFVYSSAGAFGFYPWVDVDRSLYGVVAREDTDLAVRQGYASLQCGRLIRLAWKTETVQ
jgi:hypothetical protein